MDDEVREQLESLNRRRAWLMRVTERFPDLRVYRWGGETRYCSPSINRSVDDFELADLVQRPLMPGDIEREANLAVWCFSDFEGERVYSWPPCFVLGGVDDANLLTEQRHLHPHWTTQLRESQIPALLIRRLDEATSQYPIDDDDDAWRDGDENFAVWTAQDAKGDIVGVLRVHGRMNHEALWAMRTRAECLGIKVWSHEDYTVRTARDLQAFIDDTVAYMADHDDDSLRAA